MCPVKNKLTKFDLDLDGIPVYSSESTNNGIVGNTNYEAEFIINEDNPIYIVFGDHTRSFNIATKSFCVMDNVKVLSIKEIIPVKVLLFIVSSWKKCIPDLGYSRHWSLAKNALFSLPISNNKINFDFIEIFITEIEKEQMSQLDVYLKASGLKDYDLTEEEEKVLHDFEKGKITFGELNVIDVFNVKNSGNILAREIVENSGNTPYLCASRDNNSVSSYISYDEEYMDKGNCVFIGGKTFVVTYQEKDFYSNDSHNLNLYLKKEDEKSKLKQLFLATCINKSLGYKYSWGDSISNRKIQKDKVSLPIKNKKINYKLMKIFISAIQKLVIKDVVLYTNNKLSVTK